VTLAAAVNDSAVTVLEELDKASICEAGAEPP
jgi:hypothetical protein